LPILGYAGTQEADIKTKPSFALKSARANHNTTPTVDRREHTRDGIDLYAVDASSLGWYFEYTETQGADIKPKPSCALKSARVNHNTTPNDDRREHARDGIDSYAAASRCSKLRLNM